MMMMTEINDGDGSDNDDHNLGGHSDNDNDSMIP